MSTLKCASFFAGVGGIDLGFEATKSFETIYANEFDRNAANTYESNFSLKVDCRDINIVPNSDIPDFDVMLAGFPCQAFSIAGYRQGFEDEKGRGTLFFQLLRIIKAKQPPVVFLENVKNLASHDSGNTFKVIREALESEGYHIKHDVLNTMTHGNIPQNRERIYIVAFKDNSVCDKFAFPKPVKLTKKLSDLIDYKSQQDSKFYYTAENFAHFSELKEQITNSDTLYQWRRVYVRENKSGVSPTLTANMGTGGHNVPLVLTDHGIRKLTPRECFSIQGFPKNFKLPNTAPSHLYKQAGNSVSVTVIQAIAKQIVKALKG